MDNIKQLEAFKKACEWWAEAEYLKDSVGIFVSHRKRSSNLKSRSENIEEALTRSGN